MTWNPRFTITPAVARGLMQIEASRALLEHTALSLEAESELRRRARLRYLSAVLRQFIGNACKEQR